MPDSSEELESLLDEITYEATAARTAGIGEPNKLRGALKKMRDLVQDADALAADVEMARSKEEGE